MSTADEQIQPEEQFYVAASHGGKWGLGHTEEEALRHAKPKVRTVVAEVLQPVGAPPPFVDEFGRIHFCGRMAKIARYVGGRRHAIYEPYTRPPEPKKRKAAPVDDTTDQDE